MSPMLQAFCAAALLLATPVAGVELRRKPLDLQTAGPGNASDPDVIAIHDNWDKMDDFLSTMFTLACKWKHSKDINGLAAEKLKDGDLHHSKVTNFKAKMQAANVVQLKQACGQIVATGSKRCRQSCADHWGSKMQKRGACDDKCVDAYKKFESHCRQKAGNLEQVYAMKLKMAASRKQCYDANCKGHPTVWMKEDAEAMTTELGTQCDAQCTEENIEVKCQRKWQLEVDFIMDNITQTCHEKGAVGECFKGKKDTISTDHDTCASDGKTDCETQHGECKTKGDGADTAFCDERQKMCQKEVTKKCLDEHKSALDKAKSDCEADGKDEMKTCVDEETDSKKTEAMDTCKSEKGPTCKDDCKASCGIDKMQTCLGNLESDHDAAEDFCKDFWRLLHESSEVDPMTGTPIVLLAPSAHH